MFLHVRRPKANNTGVLAGDIMMAGKVKRTGKVIPYEVFRERMIKKECDIQMYTSDDIMGFVRKLNEAFPIDDDSEVERWERIIDEYEREKNATRKNATVANKQKHDNFDDEYGF